MLTTTPCTEFNALIRLLSRLPGGVAVTLFWNSTANNPLPPGAKHSCSFRIDHAPDTLPVPGDADIYAIALDGASPAREPIDDLPQRVSTDLREKKIQLQWQPRLSYIHWQNDHYRYRLLLLPTSAESPAN